MIMLTRRKVRRLRGVFRRHSFGISHKSQIPLLVLRAEETQLRAQYRYGSVAVEHVEEGVHRPAETIALPLDALADFEGREETPVIVEATRPDTTVVGWEDHGIPQRREYIVSPLAQDTPFPALPTRFETVSAGLLDALAEATRTGADDSTRYALNCLQLRGSSGELVATDGRQLLIQGSWSFPWEGDVLVPRTPLFTCKELPRDHPIAIGRTDTHVVLRAGPWTLFLEVRTEARFPDVSRVLPEPGAAMTRLHLDPEDAAFLLPALERLPGADELHAPATLDLNGCIAVRARSSDRDEVTELVLARSVYQGAPIRIQVDRTLLARSLELGFGELEISGAETPLILRAGQRTYAMQPLSHEGALEPSDNMIRIESTPRAADRADWKTEHPKAKESMSERPHHSERPIPIRATGGQEAPAEAPAAGLAALIRDAESLDQALGEARSQAWRLIIALRRHRKKERLVNATLASLRQLKLQEAVE